MSDLDRLYETYVLGTAAAAEAPPGARFLDKGPNLGPAFAAIDQPVIVKIRTDVTPAQRVALLQSLADSIKQDA